MVIVWTNPAIVMKRLRASHYCGVPVRLNTAASKEVHKILQYSFCDRLPNSSIFIRSPNPLRVKNGDVLQRCPMKDLNSGLYFLDTLVPFTIVGVLYPWGFHKFIFMSKGVMFCK